MKANSASSVIHIIMNSFADTFESLIDELALTLFRSSFTVRDVELTLFQGVRKPSVLEAETWLKQTISRYLRLARRRSRTLSVDNDRLRDSILNSIPLVVSMEFRRQRVSLQQPLTELFRHAQEIEAVLREQNNNELPPPAGPVSSFPTDTAKFAKKDEPMPAATEESSTKRQPRKPCPKCSGNHWLKECPDKTFRCFNCREIGHSAKNCPNWVRKDTQGPVAMKTTDLPSKTQHTVRKDRTMYDRTDTAKDAVEIIKERIFKAAKTAKQKRHEKAEGKPPKRKMHDHPVAAVDYEDLPSDEEQWDEFFDEVCKAVDVDHSFVVSSSRGIQIDVAINKVIVSAMIDTGSWCSLIPLKLAKELNLSLSGGICRLNGVGKADAIITDHVNLTFPNDKIVTTRLFAIDTNLPLIIGLDLLQRNKIIIDCGKLSYASSDHVYAVKDQQFLAEHKVNPSTAVFDTVPSDIKSKLDSDMKCENVSQCDKLREILREFSDVWLMPLPCKCNKYPIEFVVEGPPIKSKIRPTPPELQPEMKRQIDAMLAKGVIVPSESPWSAPAFFVSKKTGDWRLVMDYRQLNSQMRPDSYPLPLLWQTVQKLAGKSFFSTLDLAAGFWNCPVGASSQQYTAFSCSLGHFFQYTCLPFGIRNSPAHLQRTCDIVFRDLIDKGFVVIYMDDIGIATNDIDEHFDLKFLCFAVKMVCGFS